MKILKPFYYDEFECVADKCIDTCCAGWSIHIDDETYKKYMAVEGEFGEKLRNSIKVGEKKSFILDEQKRCPFLQENMLCEIYNELGKDALSDVCTTYPRKQQNYLDIIEQSLTISCPEVARIIVEHNEPIDFIFAETESEKEVEKVEKIDLYNGLTAARSLSVDLMQIDGIPLWKKIYLCLVISDKIQKSIDQGDEKNIKNIVAQFESNEYLLTYINALDKFDDNIEIKRTYYKNLVDIICNFKITNKKFLDNTLELLEFFKNSEVIDSNDNFRKIHEEFEQHILNSRAFENYIVYFLFGYYMEAYKDNNIYKIGVLMVESYALIKLFALVKWFNNGYELSGKDMVDILYSYSRVLEHQNNQLGKLYEQIKERELDNLAYLAILIR